MDGPWSMELVPLALSVVFSCLPVRGAGPRKWEWINEKSLGAILMFQNINFVINAFGV
jgi:hypothetical protein